MQLKAPKRLRILYVEDHEDTVELVTMVLKDREYDVVAADSFETAWRMIHAKQFDLYLLDSWLADGSGLELCKKIREVDTETPVLFYSAAAYELDRNTAIAAGAQGYLVKPASLSELCDLVGRLLSANRVVCSKAKGNTNPN